VLSVINASKTDTVSVFLSLRPPCTPALGLNDVKLQEGTFWTDNGELMSCLTLILIVAPQTVVDCCVLNELPSRNKKKNKKKAARALPPTFFSDIRPLPFISSEELIKIPFYGTHIFPLEGSGPFLCSQGMGEMFTHHFPETFHAVDLDCPVGTYILAVGDGVVIEVMQDRNVGGVHCCNLWAWNSLALQLDTGGFVEYVHIKKDSVLVKPGEKVKKGQRIAMTGNVGFCPTSHLHIQFHLSKDPKAPTVGFAFMKDSATTTATATTDSTTCFVPQTGYLYNSTGLIVTKDSTKKLVDGEKQS
jgi:murein DD-endopeptidase MepM/ murein hydrolase activator NlpD